MPAAPWLTPPNFLAAMQGGAGVGAQLRGQDISAAEAAARLRYSYDAMAANQAEAQARLAASERDAAARLAQQNAALQYEQGRDVQADKFKTAAQALDEKAFAFREQQAKAEDSTFEPSGIDVPGLPGWKAARVGKKSYQLIPDAKPPAPPSADRLISFYGKQLEEAKKGLSRLEGGKLTPDELSQKKDLLLERDEAARALQPLLRGGQPSGLPGGVPAAPGAGGPMRFNSAAEAEAANLPKGTRVQVFVNGAWKSATIQ